MSEIIIALLLLGCNVLAVIACTYISRNAVLRNENANLKIWNQAWKEIASIKPFEVGTTIPKRIIPTIH